jgi:hypothetical protein
LLLSPLNHWIAPATFVSETPFWVSASSCVRYLMISRSPGAIVPAAVSSVMSRRHVGAAL